MQGIYLHIPFCRQACRYCDFYFTVSLRYRADFVDKLIEEIGLRKGENGDAILGSLYFGGGTPSLLSPGDLDRIMEAVNNSYSFEGNAEVTIECNPDDMNLEYLKELKTLGFNRISIGIQSFSDKDLQLMRRSHNAVQAEKSVWKASEAGFDNLTIDLIYGIPGQTQKVWEQNIQRAISLPIDHLSAYHLTFEPGTIFDHWLKKGKLVPVHEDQSLIQYKNLRKMLISEGFDHYEISNFARKGKMSAHNLVYWSGSNYIGFGPSAHSYNGKSRSWNISSLKVYLQATGNSGRIREFENLTNEEKYHDYLITSLRTKWGADPVYIAQHFGKTLSAHFSEKKRGFIESGLMWLIEGKVAIHPDHWLVSDHILKEFF